MTLDDLEGARAAMMKDRTLQALAENQALMMKAMVEILVVHQKDSPRRAYAEKLATNLACRADDLETMINDGLFARHQV